MLLISLNIGCLSEQSFRMRPEESRQIDRDGSTAAASTRLWLRSAHQQLEDLLPPAAPDALLTSDLVRSNGAPGDVFSHFGVQRDGLRTLLGNFSGIRCTAQGASLEYHIDNPAPPWPGFEDVWVPLKEPFSLSGRLGYARENGQVRDADCIVVLPGFFGDNGVMRTRDVAVFLRDSSFHVLALEIRGHGRTEARYPHIYHTFGVMETNDLMHVSDWLEQLPHVRRTGLIGYCWGANIALLAGWYENHPPHDPSISPAIQDHFTSFPGRRRFSAGIMAFSPILRWEELMDELDTPRSRLGDPVYAGIQQTVEDRMIRKNHPHQSGNLRNLIEFEYLAQGVPLPRGASEGYPFLRLMPYRNKPLYDKLVHARTPILIVHAANDPLSPAQDVADFISTIDNPLVAAVILPSGGHVGLAAYAKTYYYSLIANFFDPVVGAAAHTRVAGSESCLAARDDSLRPSDASPEALSGADGVHCPSP